MKPRFGVFIVVEKYGSSSSCLVSVVIRILIRSICIMRDLHLDPGGEK